MEDLMLELYHKGIDTEINTTTDGKIQVALTFMRNNATIGIATGDTLEEAMCTIVFRLSEGKYKNADMLSIL